MKTLMGLAALTISGACFAVLRVVTNPNALVFVAAWLTLILKFGYKLWMERLR